MFISRNKLAIVIVAAILITATCMTLGFLSQEPTLVQTEDLAVNYEQIDIKEEIGRAHV